MLVVVATVVMILLVFWWIRKKLLCNYMCEQLVVANLQVVVANQQAVLAKVQMFCGEFAMRLCSSVVGGSEVSDATTWTI